MTAFRLPTNLATFAAHGREPRLSAWAATLPAVVPELVERWQLTVAEAYQPGGQCSWVAPAVTAAGDAVVLKVGYRHEDAEHEAAGLRFWDGDGAVRVYAEWVSDGTSALLLERAEPGTLLAAAMAPPEQDVVVAGLLRRLWRRPPDGHPFRSLAAMCDVWAAEFEVRVETVPESYDRALLRAGIALYRELSRGGTDDVLLCTDLHPENVVAAQREPWLVIDPKPHVGDRTYDATQHLLNLDRLFADPVALVDRMAGLLDLDPERLRLWLFARCVQECPEWDDLYDVAVRLAP